MTIAARFRCNDGVVLCADTEITIPGWLKFPGSKNNEGKHTKTAARMHFCR
jgi:hypothetical protein